MDLVNFCVDLYDFGARRVIAIFGAQTRVAPGGCKRQGAPVQQCRGYTLKLGGN